MREAAFQLERAIDIVLAEVKRVAKGSGKRIPLPTIPRSVLRCVRLQRRTPLQGSRRCRLSEA